MAKLPDGLLTTIFTLQRQSSEQIEAAAATEWAILDRYGETAETMAELDEIYNVRESTGC